MTGGYRVFIKYLKRRLQPSLRVAALFLAAALVLGLFVGGAQPIAVGLVPSPWDKLVHAAVFALMAGAIDYASGLRGKRMVLLSFCCAVMLGALDELHQIYLPGRSADLGDLAADALGAALGSVTLLRRR